ncbi:transcriptional regulator [Streptacidiphilus sp. 4-A2]|nr:transcriptional regulator [Streptacidiphilus sp. 4-A2]
MPGGEPCRRKRSPRTSCSRRSTHCCRARPRCCRSPPNGPGCVRPPGWRSPPWPAPCPRPPRPSRTGRAAGRSPARRDCRRTSDCWTAGRSSTPPRPLPLRPRWRSRPRSPHPSPRPALRRPRWSGCARRRPAPPRPRTRTLRPRSPARAAGRGHRSARPAAAVARPGSEGRYVHGPLAVLDGDGTAYATGGLLLECEATTLAQLVEWTLAESGLGAPRLHRFGNDSDPLIILTASAVQRFGLPLELLDGAGLPGQAAAGEPRRRRPARPAAAGGPPGGQGTAALEVVADQARVRAVGADLPQGRGRRPAVRATGDPALGRAGPPLLGAAADLPPAELARVMGTYATRVLTPRGTTAVTGLELMTALRPPTRPVKDEDGDGWGRAFNAGALIEPVKPAPPEAPREHPDVQGWTGGFLDEEAYQWVRALETISDAETLLPNCIGLDTNTAFLGAAARLNVGLCAPEHVVRPVFDKKVPGTWRVDLSGMQLDPRLPSPFTPSGLPPTGPGWYTTQTVAYAVELGLTVAPSEAYVRPEYGAYLDPWHDRLREAYVATMANAGIPVDKDTDERQFLAAQAAHQILKRHQGVDAAALRAHLAQAGLTDLAGLDDERLLARAERHRQIEMVLTAIKGTVKGGIGKLRERPRGLGIKPGEPWHALSRPTWRPDIRAAVIAKARVTMHRKMRKMAEFGHYPLAVLSDCVVYPAPSADPMDLLPLTGAGRVLPGVFRLGATPGLVKVEGVQTMLWAIDLIERDHPLNPARHIKGDGEGDAVLEDGE